MALLPPGKVGNYRVQDYEGRQGVARLNSDKTWTPIEGPAASPYDLWSDV